MGVQVRKLRPEDLKTRQASLWSRAQCRGLAMVLEGGGRWELLPDAFPQPLAAGWLEELSLSLGCPSSLIGFS